MIIGVTQHTGQSEPQRDMIRTNYVPYILRLGHTPVVIPNNLPDVGAYLDTLNITGLVLAGGGDLDPARYRQPNTHSEHIAPQRDRTEWALLDLALARGLPVLGICRGFQVINVYLGGGLVQDIPSSLETPVPHHVEGATHPVALTDARIAAVAGKHTLTVNTHHHQGVTRDLLAPGLDVFAISPADDLVEGYAHRERPILAVQWHPERPDCPSCEADVTLFRRLFAEGAFWRAG